jgi:hypothetical protein
MCVYLVLLGTCARGKSIGATAIADHSVDFGTCYPIEVEFPGRFTYSVRFKHESTFHATSFLFTMKGAEQFPYWITAGGDYQVSATEASVSERKRTAPRMYGVNHLPEYHDTR